MKIKVNKKIGNETFQFELENEKEMEVMFEAGVYASAPAYCDNCRGSNVQLKGNKNKGYTFVYVQCLDCQAKAQLGSYKDGGHFWKKFEVFEKTHPQNENLQPEPQNENIPIIEENEVPF